MRLGLFLLLALFPFGGTDRHHVRLTLRAEPPYSVPEAELVSALGMTIEDRLERLGIEGGISAGADGLLVVDMPRVADAGRIEELLTRSVSLELRFVRFPEGGAPAGSAEAVLEHFGGGLPPELEVLEGNGGFRAVERAAAVTGRDIRTARPSRSQHNEPMIQFSLTPQAGEAFGRATGENIGSSLAIVLDGKVVSAPVIQSRITDEGIIQGAFTEEEVRELAVLLSSGPLPARVRVVGRQVSEAVPDRRFWVAMTALAVFFLLFCAVLVVLYRRGGQPRPI